MLAVELTLRYNHIQGVYEVSSTGQLIPLVLGVILMLSTALHIVWKKVNNPLEHRFATRPRLLTNDRHRRTISSWVEASKWRMGFGDENIGK